MIIGLADKTILLLYSKFSRKDFELVIEILLDNEYSLKLIFERIKSLINKKTSI